MPNREKSSGASTNGSNKKQYQSPPTNNIQVKARSQNSRPSSKDKQHSDMILFGISSLFLVLSFASIFLSKEYPITSIIIFHFITNVISFLSDLITFLSSFKQKYKSTKRKKFLIGYAIFAVILTIISFAFALNVEKKQDISDLGTNNQEESITTTKTTNPQPYYHHYPFDTITTNEEFDIFFKDSEEDDLYSDLFHTLNNLSEITKYTKKELNGNSTYSTNTAAANAFKEALEDFVSENNVIISSSKTIVTCSEELMKARETADSSAVTALNRKIYTNDLQYIYQTLYPIINIDDTFTIRKKCIRYCWGWLYASITTNDYSAAAIDKLIYLYTDIKGSCKETSEPIIEQKIDTIIKVLEDLKIEFSKNDPRSIEAVK